MLGYFLQPNDVFVFLDTLPSQYSYLGDYSIVLVAGVFMDILRCLVIVFFSLCTWPRVLLYEGLIVHVAVVFMSVPASLVGD